MWMVQDGRYVIQHLAGKANRNDDGRPTTYREQVIYQSLSAFAITVLDHATGLKYAAPPVPTNGGIGRPWGAGS
jgi:hypothetical protein